MTAFFLSLREGLEAVLIVSILLGTLRRLGRSELRGYVWLGVASAIAVSVAAAAARRCRVSVSHVRSASSSARAASIARPVSAGAGPPWVVRMSTKCRGLRITFSRASS